MSQQPQNPYGTPRTQNPSGGLPSRSRFWFLWRWLSVVLFVTSALPLALCIYFMTQSWELVGLDGPTFIVHDTVIEFAGLVGVKFSSEQVVAICGAVWMVMLVLAVTFLIRSRHRSA